MPKKSESDKPGKIPHPVAGSSRLIELETPTCSIPTNIDDSVLDVTGLIQQQARILRCQQPINWLPYLEAGLISQSDYSFVTAFQRAKTKEDRDELLDFFKDEAFKTLVHVVQRVCIVEEIQKFLVLIDDMLWEDMSRVTRFNPEQTEPWKAFLDLLSCSDDFVKNMSARIISKLISKNCGKPSKSDLKFFLSWLKNELKRDNIYLLSVTRCLQMMLKVDEYRIAFMQLNGIFRIIRILCGDIKPQAQYQLVFCLWVSSFNSKVAESLNRFSTIPLLIEILESAPSEIVKLPRIIVATFRNLLEKPREEGMISHNSIVMIQCKLYKYIEIMKTNSRNIKDPELRNDLMMIEDVLNKCIAKLSTFDEYQLELRSGRLEWSVVHTSVPFWTENAIRLNENKYELIKMLVSLLEPSNESIVLCVAAHDVGEYMRHYPRGKKVIEELGGKDALLKLLSHKHPVVKYNALKGLQILMLNNYDLLLEFTSDSKTDLIKHWDEDRL